MRVGKKVKKEKKYKVIIVVLSILLIAALGFSTLQSFRSYGPDEVNEREELLEAVMWELNSEHNILEKSEIEDITVLKSKSGIYPLNYEVALNLENGEQLLYSWKDQEKSEVWISNEYKK